MAIDGKQIYEEKCAMCHGADGKLGLSGAKDLTTTQLGHADIVTLVANGKNAMPAFSTSLNNEQIEAVTAYVETGLKGK